MNNGINDDVYAVILGGLLHDIGLFIQRASDEPLKMNHTRWGYKWFIDKIADKFATTFGEKNKIVLGSIEYHHGDVEYVTLADAISTGQDKIDLIDEENADNLFTRLPSIFSSISLTDKNNIEGFHDLSYLGCRKLDETFPQKDPICTQQEYKDLLVGFEKELLSLDLNNMSPFGQINSIYYLLWKYTWCMPSSALQKGVSLFDHLHTTAALTGCLYLFNQQNPEQSINIDSKAFRLVGGDISGIQSYIFQVLSQQGKVAKRLRARSLFVQMMSEVTSHKVLHAFNLPLCNLLMSAGGNFYLLIPDIKSTKKILEDLQSGFDAWTVDHLNAEIAINLTSIEITGRELFDFSNVMERLKSGLNQVKYHPHEMTLSSGSKWQEDRFILNKVANGDEKICQCCKKNPQLETITDDESLCDRCSADTGIGKYLPSADYLVFYADSVHKFNVLNYSFDFLSKKDIENNSFGEPYLILKLNSTDMTSPAHGFKLLSTHIPIDKDLMQKEQFIPATFDIIADWAEGDKILGYVKADVDNLGCIFRDAIGSLNHSMSQFIALSRMLETFFSGYLQKQIHEEFVDIYSVFSGGDDFYLIGPWNRVIDCAISIRSNFSLFCAENPGLTFSAGVILARPHEPLQYCTQKVEEALEKSKSYPGKDRITIFDQTLTWNEFKIIEDNVRTIVEWLNTTPPILSRKQVYNFYKYGDMAHKSGILGGLGCYTRYLEFVPLLTQDINRNLWREYQRGAYEWAINLLPSRAKPNGGENLPYLKTIMHYVLTYTRRAK